MASQGGGTPFRGDKADKARPLNLQRKGEYSMRQLNVAIVGTGFMGKLYGRILKQLPTARVVAVCDLVEAPMREFAAEIGAAAYPGADVKAMLAVQPEIEAVLICTPEDQHVEAACLAAQAGKHILVEKPLAMTAEGGQRIVDAVREAGVFSMMGYVLRFDPRYSGARDAVAKGEVGDVVHMYARRNTPLFLLRRIGGRVSGTFWVGVHDLDFMLWIKGCPATRVFSRQAGASVAEFKVDQAIVSTLQFADGSIATLENVWGVAMTPGRHDRLEFQINGTRGTVEVHPAETGLGVFNEGSAVYPDTVYMPNLHGRTVGVYRDEIEHFVSSILAGVSPVVTVEDGLKAVVVAEAIERSRATGQEVIIS